MARIILVTQALRRSSRLAISTQPYQLVDIIVYNSLDIFRRSFLGCIPGIWRNEVPICLHQDGHSFGLYVHIDVMVILCLS